MKTGQHTFIDLFAGAGGLSEGFIQAGAKPMGFIDSDPDACMTIRTRQSYHLLKETGELGHYWRYLRNEINRDKLFGKIPEDVLDRVICQEISDETIQELLKRITSQNVKIDILLGGPPCQAYSHIGRARDPNRMKGDPRNWLYRNYIVFLAKLRPSAFLFENVIGFRSAGGSRFFEDLKEQTGKLGYEVRAYILNAKEFGVLQNRRRVVVIGSLRRRVFNGSFNPEAQNGYKVDDLLSDLPGIRHGEEYKGVEYQSTTSDYLRESGIRKGHSVLTWHVARPHNERDLEIYRIAVELWNKERKRLSYDELPGRLKTHRNRTSFADRYKVVAGDLHSSQTVLAHIAKDGHYFIHPDIDQNRSLTVREAARLQSFPDNYFFEGSRTSAFRQIGNAVPPLMAKGLAEAILERL